MAKDTVLRHGGGVIATLAAGSRMPEHRHAQEQIVHILVRYRSYQQRRPRCDTKHRNLTSSLS
jgi:hypothetical protein